MWRGSRPTGAMTSLSSDVAAVPITDPVAAWFGAVGRKTGADTADAMIPEPPMGTGGSLLARLIQGTDIAAGVCACLAAAPQIAMTSDIFLHVLSHEAVGDLTARGSTVRAGRSQVVAHVDVLDSRGVRVATATANH